MIDQVELRESEIEITQALQRFTASNYYLFCEIPMHPDNEHTERQYLTKLKKGFAEALNTEG